MHIACFVSPHGLGHAARAAAVLAAIHARRPDVETDLFTLVPESFFTDSRVGPISYHALRTDLGMVQKTVFEEDAGATATELARMLPFDAALVDTLAQQLRARDCRAVLCDIAPLGIAAARKAGIPSILIENFTWDWIYGAYVAEEPRLKPLIEQMRVLFAAADHRIQTTPVCHPLPGATCVEVVGRCPRTARDAVRQQLGLAPGVRLVLVTGNLLPAGSPGIAPVRGNPAYVFLLVGGGGVAHREGNIITLPATLAYYHPDLVHAADVVVGKLGYSTLAETYHAGIPFAYLPRPRFPESAPMEAFARAAMPSARLEHAALADGRWLQALPELLERPRVAPRAANGADEIADWLVARVLRA